jgi:hypothetical protein
MVDRIGAVGGELTIDSSLGRGTTIRGTVPTDARDLTPDRTPAMH